MIHNQKNNEFSHLNIDADSINDRQSNVWIKKILGWSAVAAAFLWPILRPSPVLAMQHPNPGPQPPASVLNLAEKGRKAKKAKKVPTTVLGTVEPSANAQTDGLNYYRNLMIGTAQANGAQANVLPSATQEKVQEKMMIDLTQAGPSNPENTRENLSWKKRLENLKALSTSAQLEERKLIHNAEAVLSERDEYYSVVGRASIIEDERRLANDPAGIQRAIALRAKTRNLAINFDNKAVELIESAERVQDQRLSKRIEFLSSASNEQIELVKEWDDASKREKEALTELGKWLVHEENRRLANDPAGIQKAIDEGAKWRKRANSFSTKIKAIKETLLAQRAQAQHVEPQHAQAQHAQAEHVEPQHVEAQHAGAQHVQPDPNLTNLLLNWQAESPS